MQTKIVTKQQAYFDFQKKIVIAFSIIGFFTFSIFGSLHILQQSLILGFFEIFITIIIVANLLIFLVYPKEEPHSMVILTVMIIAFYVLITTGGLEDTGIYWVNTFPIIAFGLKRLKIGAVWTIAMFIVLITVLILQAHSYFSSAYTLIELRQAAFSFTVIAILVFFLTQFIEKRERIFIEQDETLLSLNKKLNKSFDVVNKEKIHVNALLSSIGDGLIVTDQKGKIELINKSCLEILNTNRDKLIGKPMCKAFSLRDKNGKVIPKQDRPCEMILHAKKNEIIMTPPDYPHYIKRKDGILSPISIVIAPVLLNKEVVGSVMTFRDVTEEARISEEKSEFISITSHQLRTPLTSLRWSFELLEDEKRFSKEAKELIKTAGESTESMIKLVSDLLNVSRIEIGTLKIEPKRTNPTELMNEAINEVKPLAVKKSCEITFNDKEKLPMMMVDPDLLHQIIHNILTNAIKYSPKKTGKIQIDFTHEDSSILLSVKDNGTGIPKQYQNNIFQKFFRTPDAEQSSQEGTGLGLYFAKKAVDTMNGEIWFKSEEKKGTTFFVRLPIK
ncbi:MAG: ATP-binding protein [Patescibacteria group bacterium]